METTTDWWAGPWGDSYTERNVVNWEARIPFLRRILELTSATSFLDVGCNAGWNMRALKAIGGDQVTMSGIDVNDEALGEAVEAGFDVINCPAIQCCDDPLSPDCAEMVLCSGVLIHVPPDELALTMAAMRDAASQYVLAIEYAADADTEVEYRGHTGRLWKRPFGEHFLAVGGLALVETGEAEGYDQCRYWLLEKTA